jgi:DNA primase
VILCEALIDPPTFWWAGYRNVTASYGVEGFTADHLALFKQCGIQRVLIAYDRDEAGERGAETCRAPERGRTGRVPHPLPKRDGCERVRVEGGAGVQEFRGGDPLGAVAR